MRKAEEKKSARASKYAIDETSILINYWRKSIFFVNNSHSHLPLKIQRNSFDWILRHKYTHSIYSHWTVPGKRCIEFGWRRTIRRKRKDENFTFDYTQRFFHHNKTENIQFIQYLNFFSVKTKNLRVYNWIDEIKIQVECIIYFIVLNLNKKKTISRSEKMWSIFKE